MIINSAVKKGVGCSQAVHTARNIVTCLVNGGSTVSLCALDLSKAFDEVNLCALYVKLMKRCLPVELLDLLVHWLDHCLSCVKWCGVLSKVFKLSCGVRQGSVQSSFYLPYT